MEFFLVKDVEGKIMNSGDGEKLNESSMPVELKPCGNMEDHIKELYTDRVCSIIDLAKSKLTGRMVENSIDIKLSGRLSPADGVNGDKMHLYSFTYQDNSFYHKVFSTFQTRIQGQSATEGECCNAAVRIKVRQSGADSGWELDSYDTNCPISASTNEVTNKTWYGISIAMGKVPPEVVRAMTTGDKTLTCIFTVILVLNNAALNRLFIPNPTPYSVTLQGMWKRVAVADTDIIPGGRGVLSVKCSRVVLSDRSPVFKSMFHNEKAAAHIIRIPDMSETAVRILIKYIYTGDVAQLVVDSHFAMEMLKAAKRYQLADLSAAVYKLMMMKPYDWFTVNVTVNLHTFVEDLCSSGSSVVNESRAQHETWENFIVDQTRWKKLEQKALKAMNWHSELLKGEFWN